jgi:serine/threonine protein kinase
VDNGKINSIDLNSHQESALMSDPLINKQLGDYSIVDLLGQGGMARIYRGFDAKLERYAAIKVIDSTLATSQDAEEYHARFQREARAIARLRHPNIVNIYQFGEMDSTYYMAMAFLEGQDLRWLLKDYAERGEKMPGGDVYRIIRDIASALDYAHQQGVIHRDIKPSNIMVTPGGSAVLMDFGLALHVPEGTTGNIFGTAHYIAPEQAVSSANAVPQSDLYSLGIVLYEMLVGQVPFDDPSAMSVALKHLNEPPPPPRRYNSDISLEVEAVVLRALEKEPEDRYPNGAAIARALEVAMQYKDEDATLKDPPPPRMPVGPPPEMKADKPSSLPALPEGRGNLVWIGAAVVVAIVLIAALLFINSGNSQGDVRATQTAIALAIVTDEPTAAPTNEPTDSATTVPEDTDAPTTAATEDMTEQATDVPSATDAPTEVVAVVPTMDAESAEVSLLYDIDSLTLLNQSSVTVDVSGLTFVQATASGGERTFATARWEGGSRPPNALPAGDCFQVWTIDLSTMPRPRSCDTRHAQAQVGQQSWFWINDDPDATFQVVRRRSGRADQVLATCTIGEGECFVLLDGGRVASEPTIEPTERPTTNVLTTVPTVVPTNTPARTPTESLTDSPTIIADTPIVLIYDEQSLVLFNRSNRIVDVNGLTFVQTTDSGRELSFGTERWDGGSRPTWALPAGDCFQVWTDSVTSTLPKPDYCDTRHSWQSVGTIRWFWISNDSAATFAVRRDDEVLAVCEISAGECGLDVD